MFFSRSLSGLDGTENRRHWTLFGGGYVVVLLVALLLSTCWLLLFQYPEPDLGLYCMWLSCLVGAFLFAAMSAFFRGSVVISFVIGAMLVLFYGLFDKVQLWNLSPPPALSLRQVPSYSSSFHTSLLGGPICALTGFVVGWSVRNRRLFTGSL